ncbi:TPA: hypothetical protein L5694_002643 [Pseudomonas aeruginosa]|nr:hypothetical protein [Pseudomonas aeruginosa]
MRQKLGQALLPLGSCPIMLFAPALADREILPATWVGSYFFNRIGH